MKWKAEPMNSRHADPTLKGALHNSRDNHSFLHLPDESLLLIAHVLWRIL